MLNNVTPLPQLFKENGYYTAAAGKVGHGYPLRNRSDACWHEKMKHSRDPVHPDAPLNGWARNRKGKPTEKDWGPTHLPEAEMRDTQYADFAVRQLRKKHDTPFFIACGIFHPHFPWYVPQQYLDRYPLDDIAVPPIQPDDQSDIPPAGLRLINEGLDKNIKKHGQVKQAIQ